MTVIGRRTGKKSSSFTPSPARSRGADAVVYSRREEGLGTLYDRLMTALAASRVGIWDWDIGTDILFCTAETCEILGKKEDRGPLKAFTRLIHPADRDGVLSAMQEAIAGGTVFSEEFRIIHEDGNPRWLSATGRAVYDGAGTPSRFTGTVLDITDRKRFQSEAFWYEQKLTSFFGSSTVGLSLLDRELRYIQINDTLAEMNGIPAADHIGRTVSEVLPDIAPFVEPKLLKVLSTGRPLPNFEVCGETPGQPGIQRHWMESFFPTTDIHGQVDGIGAVVVEITQRKRAEEAVRTYSKELEEMNSALRVLLRQRDQDRQEIEERVAANVKHLVLPYLGMLKGSRAGNPADSSSISIMESNLNEITSSFGASLTHKLNNLTPREILVANLVRLGSHDKEIAETLHVSIDTVKAHRRNIRKKLDLVGNKANLSVFLSQNYK